MSRQPACSGKSWGILMTSMRAPEPLRDPKPQLSTRERYDFRPLTLTWQEAAHDAVEALLSRDPHIVPTSEFLEGFKCAPEEILSELDEHDWDELFFQDYLAKNRQLLREGATPPFKDADLLRTKQAIMANSSRQLNGIIKQILAGAQTTTVRTCEGMHPPQGLRPPVASPDEASD
ncbi:hypothetical protein [Zhihengliuella flava]|uniref:Uncharacterized protein n=1 Tax=Zhihengliuella flava TaxID=1285193 RepID=A0A931D4Q9_9MICC|nr:hypothetical protein [Zhihengliuella flava]MBG6084389.1 hypothetical protein [Zhihengliuella flava]